jgi:GTP cyclohydrolase I
LSILLFNPTLARCEEKNMPKKVKKKCVDKLRVRSAVRELLMAIGEDPNRDGLRDTPDRLSRMYEEICGGLFADPARHLKTTFSETYNELVLLRDIPFYSICEHHLLPFMGRAHVAYIPQGKIVGISKLARVVEDFARRPQVQERLTNQIADLLMEKLDASGVAVLIEATHTCMTIRGVKKPGAVMTTSAIRGHFHDDLAARNELFALIRSRNPL